uniref:Cnn_1N domain-containing protein n=1 Tax=Strongyloides stercoralis TaxID=6248 RepID=A0A0K0DZH8_STRER
MSNEYSFSEFEDNLCSKVYSGCLEDLKYDYYINTLLADNEITNDLTADNINFDVEKDGNNMPKAIKTIDSLKKQNHSLRSRLMILTRDVPFMKALTSDQKIKLIIKLRLHIEKLIRKNNQLKKYKKDDQISKLNNNLSTEKTLKDNNNLNCLNEGTKDIIKEESLSLQVNSQVERLLIENKYLRDKIDNLEKNKYNDQKNIEGKNNEVMLIKTEFNINIKDDKHNSLFNQINDIDNINELKYHIMEMRKCYDELLKKHLEITNTLNLKNEKIFELKNALKKYENFKKI